MSTERNIMNVFGGAEKIVADVADTVRRLCLVRQWDANKLAAQAFPATARAASRDHGNTPRAEKEFAEITAIAQSLISNPSEKLPTLRILLAFLDALHIPLQALLKPRLSEDDRKYWQDSLKSRGIKGAFGATGKNASDMDASFELLLALEALKLICQPEPAPTPEQTQRRQTTRTKVRDILGLPRLT